MESDFFRHFIHGLLLVTTPPFFLGLINKTKAIAAGRRGPPLLQAYYDLAKLFRRGTVLSTSSSLVSRLAPTGILACVMMAGLFLPLAGTPVLHFEGDIILFVYLLALARFLIVLLALDAGSSFEGMGASREATFGAFSEPAFVMGLIVLILTTHSLSFNGIFQWEGNHPALKPAFFLVFLAFIITLLTENSRMPADDPNTHLELTMIHEVMILDAGGPELGIILYGSAVKLFLYMVLAVSVLWPPSHAYPVAAGLSVLLKAGLMCVIIGVVESVTARIRLKKMPGFLVVNFVIASLALLVTVFGGNR